MGLFSNPLGYAGYPATETTAQTVNSTVRAATQDEVDDGTLKNVYVSPLTLSTNISANFASPPPIGNVAPNTGAFTTLEVTTGPLTLDDGVNVVAGTTTGTKIGTLATQKFGFYGVTPIVQPAAATDILAALISLGLIASGASPLNLGSAALASGTHTLSDGANVVVGSTTGTKFGTATTQKMGWYNATPVVQQLQGAITNSVTTGGTTGTIANYTDLTVYANDAAAIRNDIYQLALGLGGCIAALRTYGLLA